MGDIAVSVERLIQQVKGYDPALFQALSGMNDQIELIWLELFPLIRQSIAQAQESTAPASPISFSFIFTSTTVRLSWSEVLAATQYEIRKGASWDTASFVLRSVSLQADIDPLLVGTHTYLIKSISSAGVYSTNPTMLVVTVPSIPAVSLSSQIISNNVLLFWTEPTSSFMIDHYEVFKDAVSLGTIKGTFFTRFETVAGTYVYEVIATDVAGNVSGSASLSLTLDSPPDFELQDTRVSTFSGTKTACALESPTVLVAPVDITETYQAHFTTRTWAGPSAQVAAGYPYFIQPIPTPGTYLETVDYGLLLSSLIVTVTYNQNQVFGATTVLIEMAVSPDNITYSSFVAGATQFYPSFRYIKFRLTFTPTTDKAILQVFNLTYRLDAKREQDGGIISCVSTDVGGTTVTFNKFFKDIDSIVATPMSTVERKAVIDFTDIPNPTSFKVLLYNAAGARVSGDVRWVARGVV